MGKNGNTIYREGKIIVEKTFFEKVCYDAGNNLITAQFDGRGGVSKYAVMNKFSVFSAFYSTYSVNGKPLGWDMDKRVEMIGRTQRVFFSVPEADFAVTYFLDGTTNAVFCEVEVSARERVEFRNVINFGINFSSYLEQLLANRLSVKNIRKIVGGLIRNRKPSLTVCDGVGYIRNDVMGDFYLDFAVGEGAEVLEKERNFYNQFAFGGTVDAGSKKSFRYVMSAGTRGDFTFCDVVEAFGRFDASYAESEAYVASFACPEGLDDFHRSFYNSLVNCSLSNYKELGDFKGFLAGIVYQFPARTYYRDSYWTVLSVLPVKPELVRNQIITLCKGVNHKTGECPSAVKFNFRNYWGNHYDSPSFLAIMIYDYVAHTGDRSVLDEKAGGKTVLQAARRVIERLRKETDETGLLVKGGEYNRRDWCDNVFRGGYVTYDEGLYARALYALAALFKGRDDCASAEYAAEYEKVKAAINDLLWDEEKGWFVNYREKDFTEDNLSVDTVVVPLFGLTDDARARRMLGNMERLLESRNNTEQKAGDFGVFSVYPFYKNLEDVVQKSSVPYYYHNGGDWPYLSGMYAYAKLMYGMDYEYPLTRWFEYNAERGNYTPVEFFSPVHPDGSLLQAWSSTGAFVLKYPDGKFFTKTLD